MAFDIKDIELHEGYPICGGDVVLLRVRGGWIYKFYDYDPTINGYRLVSTEFVKE
jgi:hypothetical protein